MAPKRKRAAATAVDAPAVNAPSTSTRASRSATRAVKAATETTSQQASPSTVYALPEGDNAAPPPAKKTKPASKPRATRAKRAPKSRDSGDDGADDDSLPGKADSRKAAMKTTSSRLDSVPIKGSLLSDLSKTSMSRTQPPPAPIIYERYSAARAAALFEKYADADDSNVIGPEGFTQLCSDAHIPMDGALPLILAWQFQAKEMGKLTREEWVSATSILQISSLPQLTVAVMDLDHLLIRDGQPLKRSSLAATAKTGSSNEPYDRSTYWTYTVECKKAFSKLYMFCFALAKPPQARNIDMETATAFWSVLLAPQYPLMEEVIEFINEKGTYRGANKDLWGMMLEFCQSVKPSLEDYEADGAWPTLLDDFAIWKRSKSGDGHGGPP